MATPARDFIVPPSIALEFATPRKLPKASEVHGRVVVLDVAFASEASGGGFEGVTKPFIDGLGDRLAMWVDHHDHAKHDIYRNDPRFVLHTKAEHGACPEIIVPEIVKRAGVVDTIVCHTDFDGLCSAAKWLRGGTEPYPGADRDAHAVDTRLGRPSSIGERFDRAIRARPRDTALFGIIVRHLAAGIADASLWLPIDEAGRELAVIEERTRKLASGYEMVRVPGAKTTPIGRPFPEIAFVEVSREGGRYDKTQLLLMGQERCPVAIVVDGENLTVAAAFDSGFNFLDILGLSGGMPTLVSVSRKKLCDLFAALGATGTHLPK